MQIAALNHIWNTVGFCQDSFELRSFFFFSRQTCLQMQTRHLELCVQVLLKATWWFWELLLRAPSRTALFVYSCSSINEKMLFLESKWMSLWDIISITFINILWELFLFFRFPGHHFFIFCLPLLPFSSVLEILPCTHPTRQHGGLFSPCFLCPQKRAYEIS